MVDGVDRRRSVVWVGLLAALLVSGCATGGPGRGRPSAGDILDPNEAVAVPVENTDAFPAASPIGLPVNPETSEYAGSSPAAGVELSYGDDAVVLRETSTGRVLKNFWAPQTSDAYWPVTAAALSGDGRTVAVGAGADIFLFDALTGEPTHHIVEASGRLSDRVTRALALSDDGTRLLAAVDDGYITRYNETVYRLYSWNLETGKQISSPYKGKRGDSIEVLSVSPDGTRAVFSEIAWDQGRRLSSGNGRLNLYRVRVFDVNEGDVVTTLEDAALGAGVVPGRLHISADGRYVLAREEGRGGDEPYFVYDLAEDDRLATLPVTTDWQPVAFGDTAGAFVTEDPALTAELSTALPDFAVQTVSREGATGGQTVPTLSFEAAARVLSFPETGDIALGWFGNSGLRWRAAERGTGRPVGTGAAQRRLEGVGFSVPGNPALGATWTGGEDSVGFDVVDTRTGAEVARLSYRPGDDGYAPAEFEGQSAYYLWYFQADRAAERFAALGVFDNGAGPVPVALVWDAAAAADPIVHELEPPAGGAFLVWDGAPAGVHVTMSLGLSPDGSRLAVVTYESEYGYVVDARTVRLLESESARVIAEWSDDDGYTEAVFVSDDQLLTFPRAQISDWGLTSSVQSGGEWAQESLGTNAEQVLPVPEGGLFVATSGEEMTGFQLGAPGRDAQMWSKPVTFSNPRLISSGGGESFYVVYGNGVVEMRETANGSVVTSTLVDGQQGEWLTWTPDGYFTGSDAALQGSLYIVEGLQTFAMDQLFDRYYRPDIIEARIAGRDVTPAAPEEELAEALLPLPRVRLEVEQADGSFSTLTPAGMAAGGVAAEAATAANTALSRLGGGAPVPISESNIRVDDGVLRVRIVAADRGGGAEELRLFHNGTRVSGQTRGLVAEGQAGSGDEAVVREFAIELIDGENVLRAVAFTRTGIESNPAIIALSYEAERVVRPTLWLLAVGVNEYENPAYNLNYAVGDAEGFVEAVESAGGGLFDRVERRLLTDNAAGGAAIRAAFAEITAEAEPEDVFMFFYAGHGIAITDEETGRPVFHFVPPEVTQMTSPEQLAERAISGPEFEALVTAVPARKQFHVLDACNAGAINTAFGLRGGAEEIALSRLSRSTGSALIAASRDDQFAQEFEALGQGALTRAVLDGLGGAASGDDAEITVGELKSYVEATLPELTAEYAGRKQYPTGFIFGQDFPVGVR